MCLMVAVGDNASINICEWNTDTKDNKEKDRQRIHSAEMKFLRRTEGCSLRDHINNEYIRADYKHLQNKMTKKTTAFSVMETAWREKGSVQVSETSVNYRPTA